MNQEDITRMAREAGCLGPGKGGDPNGLWEPNGWENVTELMLNFAALVAVAEREACARMAEAFHQHGYDFTGDFELHEAIRARGQA